MYKFAHITDCHLGAWRNPKLRDLNLKAFEQAISKCIAESVNFIVITGDFFDINIPDLVPVKGAVEILKNAKDKGIAIYIIYGSHDFSPNTVSMIDILHSAGLFTKPVQMEQVDNKLRLQFLSDTTTGAKITGLSGRKGILDRKYYEMLDTAYLESEDGFKIFLFHAPITEATPLELSHGDTVPLSLFPKGFDYYGGGHLHRRIEHKFNNYGIMVYPGPVFGSSFTDLENTATGEKRGFYIITFDKDVRKVQFVEINVIDILFHTVNGDQVSANKVDKKISDLIEKIEPKDKIVLIKLKGIMSSGKRSEIEFGKYEEILSKKGAVVSFINRSGLSSVETRTVRVIGESKEEIEERIITERIGSFKVDSTIKDEKTRQTIESRFVSDAAKQTSKDLLQNTKIEKMSNETVNDHQARVLKNIKSVLKFS